MKTRLLSTLFSGALLAASFNVSANLVLDTTSATQSNINLTPENNNLVVPIYGSSPRDGWYGAQVTVTVASDLVFTYLGKEAGYVNLFQLDEDLDTNYTTIFRNNNPETTVGTTYTVAASVVQTWIDSNSGVIPFQYKTNVTGTSQLATNGSNTNNSTANDVNFFASVDGSDGTATSGSSLITFLDDGNDTDDNHDDMAVQISAVPLPAAVWLFGSALMGIAGLGYRRNQKA